MRQDWWCIFDRSHEYYAVQGYFTIFKRTASVCCEIMIHEVGDSRVFLFYLILCVCNSTCITYSFELKLKLNVESCSCLLNVRNNKRTKYSMYQVIQTDVIHISHGNMTNKESCIDTTQTQNLCIKMMTPSVKQTVCPPLSICVTLKPSQEILTAKLSSWGHFFGSFVTVSFRYQIYF